MTNSPGVLERLAPPRDGRASRKESSIFAPRCVYRGLDVPVAELIERGERLGDPGGLVCKQGIALKPSRIRLVRVAAHPSR